MPKKTVKKGERAKRQQRWAEGLNRLHAISLDISASFDLPVLLKTVVEHAVHLLNASGGSLYRCDASGRRLECVVSFKNPVDYTGNLLAYGQGAAGIVAETGEPLIVNDYLDWPHQLWVQGEEHTVNAVLTVPLLWHGEISGVLQVIDRSGEHEYTREDQELLFLFADQAAIVIENARLLSAERSEREQAEILREAARVVSSSLDPPEVLRRILEQLKRVLTFDTASVMLLEEKGQPAMIAGIGYAQPEVTSRLAGETLKSSPILRRMIQDLQPLLINDCRLEPEWIWVPGAEHVRSFMGVPIVARQKMIGVMMIDNAQPYFFTVTDLNTTQALARHMGIAIENARLFEAQEKRTAELEAVHQASLGLTSSLELEDVLEAILTNTLKLLPNAQDAHIYLYHADDDTLTFGSALWAGGKTTGQFAVPRKNGLTYTVAHSGKPVIVNDISSHPLFEDFKWEGSIAGLPLKIGEQVVGVMNVACSKMRQFSEAELRVLRLLGDQAAIAIENASLYAQVAAERRHLELLYDILRELATSLDTDSILERAIDLTYKALGGEVGEAFLYLPEEKRLSLRSIKGRRVDSVNQANGTLDFKLGVGLAGWVAENLQPQIIADISKEPRWIKVPGLHEDIVSAITAPILDENRLLGVFAVLHKKPAAFNKAHLELLKAICQQVGLALSNAQRYQQVQNLVDLLEEEQNRLKSLIEWLPVGVLLLDADFRLMAVNQIGSENLAAFTQVKIGEKLGSLGDHTLEELTFRHVDPLPMEIRREGPPDRFFEVQARPIGGEQVQWVLTLRDVTRERENQLRTQMQERLATVGQLAAGIAHDFNNIMAAILVYTDLLTDDLSAYPASRERLAIIREQVQRAASLIRQILDFSRRSVMEPSTLDLLPFLKELIKLLHRVLPETIRLELVCLPGVYLVNADPTRLQQVFMNLALNASDAMPKGGDLRFIMDAFPLKADELPPTAEMPAGNWVRIIATDTGHGILPEDLPHVFEPFFTTKPAGQGTGLGLAQVYGIVKQHNGYIDVASQAGSGTTFTIYLPAIAYARQETYVQEAIPLFDGAGATVLLAEDDAPTRDAVRALLETYNFHVLSASNGIEALNLYNQEHKRIALVISDMVMPRMGGMALYQAIKKHRPRTRMLLMTGHPLGTEDQDILQKGTVRWLQKPFSMQDFSKALQLLFTPGADGRKPSGKIKGMP